MVRSGARETVDAEQLLFRVVHVVDVHRPQAQVGPAALELVGEEGPTQEQAAADDQPARARVGEALALAETDLDRWIRDGVLTIQSSSCAGVSLFRSTFGADFCDSAARLSLPVCTMVLELKPSNWRVVAVLPVPVWSMPLKTSPVIVL